MNQEIIRNDFKNYLIENGIKAKFIASKIGISAVMISYFINGKKNLSANRLISISDIIYK